MTSEWDKDRVWCAAIADMEARKELLPTRVSFVADFMHRAEKRWPAALDRIAELEARLAAAEAVCEAANYLRSFQERLCYSCDEGMDSMPCTCFENADGQERYTQRLDKALETWRKLREGT